MPENGGILALPSLEERWAPIHTLCSQEAALISGLPSSLVREYVDDLGWRSVDIDECSFERSRIWSILSIHEPRRTAMAGGG